MYFTVLYCVICTGMLWQLTEAGGGGGGIDFDCVEDSDCYDPRLICVGPPCDSICACKPGFKPCRYSGECIPDLSDSIPVGGNCSLDSECIGTNTFCRRTNKTNANGDFIGACATGASGGKASLQRGGGQGGGSVTVRPMHALYVAGTLLVMMCVAGSREDSM